MKAAFFKEHGGSEKIVYGDYRDPAPGAGEVVVRVRACALNSVDMLLLDGRFPPPEGLPHVNGCEVAGTVETLAPAVTGVTRGAAGDRLPRLLVRDAASSACGASGRCACATGISAPTRTAATPSWCKVPAGNCLPLPESISFEAGAAVPLAFLTSWHALVVKAELPAGPDRAGAGGGQRRRERRDPDRAAGAARES